MGMNIVVYTITHIHTQFVANALGVHNSNFPPPGSNQLRDKCVMMHRDRSFQIHFLKLGALSISLYVYQTPDVCKV